MTILLADTLLFPSRPSSITFHTKLRTVQVSHTASRSLSRKRRSGLCESTGEPVAFHLTPKWLVVKCAFALRGYIDIDMCDGLLRAVG
jgi:hypothetical protein